MKREEVVSFCQFLIRHKQIVAETARKVLAEFDKDPLSGGPLTILRRDNAAKRSGAILIVQFLAQHPSLWLGESCEPLRLADLWEKNPDGIFDSGTFQALMRGETPVSQRAFPADADTVAGHAPKQGSYIPPRKVSARQPAQAPTQAKQPALIRVGAHVVPREIGSYVVDRQLGEGGMGAVFLVHHKRTGLPFALKMRLASNADPEANRVEEDRFVREAKAMLMVTSAFVARAYELGEGDGEQYLVMEWIRGKDLTATLKDLPALDPMPGIRLLRDTAKGVQAFHAAGLIHRDIKPANVMVDESGCPKVIDSGLVRSVTGPADAPMKPGVMPTEADITNGVMLGTPQFMAPEQALSNPVTPATDVYSLTKTLYFVLTGKHLHEGSSINILSHVCQDQPLPDDFERRVREKLLSGPVSARMMGILRKGLAFRKEDRYQNAGELAQELDDLLNWWIAREAQKKAELAKEFERQIARNRKLVIGLAITAVVTMLFVALAIAVNTARRNEQARAEAESKRARAETLKVEVAAQFLEAQVLIRSAQWVRAEAALLALIERDATYEPARFELARVQFNLRKVVCATHWEWLAQHGSASRRSEYAFYTLFCREELDPKLSRVPYRDLLSQITDPRYQAIADVYLLMGEAEASSRLREADRAKQLLDQAVARIQDPIPDDELAWLAYGLKGYATWKSASGLPPAERLAKNTEAMLLLNRSVGRNPDFPMTWQWLGSVYRDLDQFGPAAAAFERLEALMAGWGMPRYMAQDCRLLIAGRTPNLPFESLRAISDEARRVSEEVLQAGGLEPRQSFMARLVLMRARMGLSGAYNGLNRPQDAQRETDEAFRLAEELAREPNLLPDETAYLQRILSRRRQK